MFRNGSSDSTLGDGGCSLVRVSVSECRLRCTVFKVQTLQVSSQSVAGSYVNNSKCMCIVIQGSYYNMSVFIVDLYIYNVITIYS